MADKSGNMDRIKAKRWQNTTNNIWSNFYEEIIRSRDTGIVCLWSHGFAVLFVHEAKKEDCGHVGIYGDANNFSFIAPPHGREKQEAITDRSTQPTPDFDAGTRVQNENFLGMLRRYLLKMMGL